MDGLKFLAFDTGGTIVDWHGGLAAALSEAGERTGIARDWHDFVNEYRRRALKRMTGTLDPLSTSMTCTARYSTDCWWSVASTPFPRKTGHGSGTAGISSIAGRISSAALRALNCAMSAFLSRS